MTVNLEIKGTLARLLATEDLIIEHKSVSTASFNVDTRTLTLPRWEKADDDVYDLLISHEVGHALYTPNEDWTQRVSCPGGFVNVTEDARIEKLMKRKFAGLPKTFYNGYKQLNEDDFFQIGDEDYNEFGIADRANLYFKVGNFLDIKFTDKEMEVINIISKAETFDEALAAAEALYALHQEQQEEQEKVADNNDQQQPAGGEGEQQESDEETDESDEGEGDNNEKSDSQGNDPLDMDSKAPSGEQEGAEHGGPDKVRTADSLEEKFQSLTSENVYEDPIYIELPNVDLDEYVIPNNTVHDYINGEWNKYVSGMEEHYAGERQEEFYALMNINFGQYAAEYSQFKRDIQSEVNYLVKEFECKKAATSYARATTSKTGVLDCTKLHTYKYSDDIFKKVTTLHEGKNHGLIFILDWSGSMAPVLQDTMKQLLSLVMFCEKVSIPFEVYTFTYEWGHIDGDYYESYGEKKLEENKFYIPKHFNMLNVLSSKNSRKVNNKQMETLFMISAMYTNERYGNVPAAVQLSGTPLNEALVTLHKLIPQFQNKTGVEKVHTMVLTDGEAHTSSFGKNYTRKGQEKHIGIGRIDYSTNAYIRSRSTGHTRRVFGNLTKVLLDDLQATFPLSTFTGFRIVESGGSQTFIRRAVNYDEKILGKWKKEKTIALTGFGYDKYLIVAAKSLRQSTEFEVDDDASKAKIKSAFAKSLKSKKSNKKILGDFIDLIA